MRIKTHLNKALYELTSDYFKHKLIIAEAPAGYLFKLPEYHAWGQGDGMFVYSYQCDIQKHYK